MFYCPKPGFYFSPPPQIAALTDRPLSSLCSQDQLQQKIICPGPVTCLTASPNGLYILAGVAESIYLWEVRSAPSLLRGWGGHWDTQRCWPGLSELPRFSLSEPREAGLALKARQHH